MLHMRHVKVCVHGRHIPAASTEMMNDEEVNLINLVLLHLADFFPFFINIFYQREMANIDHLKSICRL